MRRSTSRARSRVQTQLSHIGDDNGESDSGKEIAGEFVVPGGDPPEVLEAAEAPFNDVSPFVGLFVEAMQMDAVGLVRDDGPGPALDNLSAEFIAIVPLIGDQSAHRWSERQDLGCRRDVGVLAGREVKGMGTADGIAQRVDFGRANAARAADCLRALPPYPPLAERCALTEVLSSGSTTRSLGQSFKYCCPSAALGSTIEAVIDDGVWTILRRAIPPSRS